MESKEINLTHRTDRRIWLRGSDFDRLWQKLQLLAKVAYDASIFLKPVQSIEDSTGYDVLTKGPCNFVLGCGGAEDYRRGFREIVSVLDDAPNPLGAGSLLDGVWSGTMWRNVTYQRRIIDPKTFKERTEWEVKFFHKHEKMRPTKLMQVDASYPLMSFINYNKFSVMQPETFKSRGYLIGYTPTQCFDPSTGRWRGVGHKSHRALIFNWAGKDEIFVEP